MREKLLIDLYEANLPFLHVLLVEHLRIQGANGDPTLDEIDAFLQQNRASSHPSLRLLKQVVAAARYQSADLALSKARSDLERAGVTLEEQP